MSAVGHNAFTRVDHRGIKSAGEEGSGYDLARKQFAVGGDVVGSSRSEFTNGGDAAQEFVEGVEVSFEFAVELGENARPKQFAGGVVVALTQAAGKFERRFTVAS